MDFSQVAEKIEQFFKDGEENSRVSGQIFRDFETEPEIMMITKGHIKLVTYATNGKERIQYIAGPGEAIPMHNLFSEVADQFYPLFCGCI